VSTSPTGAKYQVSGRALASPYSIEINRKIGPVSATGNDHVIVRVSKTDPNSTTAKPATVLCTLDISIPRDNATVTPTEVLACVGVLASLLNDCAALAATSVNRTALIEGRDL